MRQSCKELTFNADECMVEPKRICKVICPSDVHHVIIRPNPENDHVSVMCCYSCSGQSAPLFVIVKNLQNCPNDLKPLTFGTGGIVVASSSNDYMTKDLFLA